MAIWMASVALGIGPGSGAVGLVLRLAGMGAAIGAALWFFALKAEDRTMLLQLALRRGGASTTSSAVSSA